MFHDMFLTDYTTLLNNDGNAKILETPHGIFSQELHSVCQYRRLIQITHSIAGVLAISGCIESTRQETAGG